jgi:hypothetical protein
MKTLPKMEINEDLDAQIRAGMKLSELCKADVIRQALRIGLPQFASRFHPSPLWLEERIREALAEPGEVTSRKQFDKTMEQIANGSSSSIRPFTSGLATTATALQFEMNVLTSRRSSSKPLKNGPSTDGKSAARTFGSIRGWRSG